MDVRFASKADICSDKGMSAFSPNSDRESRHALSSVTREDAMADFKSQLSV
jgi:hypothetical protein